MSDVLVINASYEVHDRVSVEHALRMLVRKVAVIEKAVEGRFIGPFPYPEILRLVRYVRVTWREHKPSWSRKRLFHRDHYTCAFLNCNERATTVEHEPPKSQGGYNYWEGTVAACRKHNAKKRNRTLAQAGMEFKFKPWAPTWEEIYS